MTSITLTGSEFGKLAAEGVIKRQGHPLTRNELREAFYLVLNEVVEQRHEEQGEAAALAFDVAARRAFTSRLAELDALAEQAARSRQ